MKRPIRWLAAAYLAVLALWLILGGVSLGKNAWYAHKGMKAQTELAWQDLNGVGVQELEGQGEGVWYVSTDTDSQLHWTAPNPEGIYLWKRWSCAWSSLLPVRQWCFTGKRRARRIFPRPKWCMPKRPPMACTALIWAGAW